MKKDTCEKCGKELGYFSRSYSIKNPRIKIQYDCLCSNCHRTMKQAIDQIDRMYQKMMGRLKNDYGVTNMGAVDIDTLIFLAVEAIMTVEPKYYDENSVLNQTIINRTERSADKMRDIAKIAYRLIDYGFSGNLQNAELASFSRYFDQTVLYSDQIQANCTDKAPRAWTNLFLSSRGLIIEQVETRRVQALDFPPDKEVRFSIRKDDSVQEIRLSNILYDWGKDRSVSLYSTDESQVRLITHALDRFNGAMKDRKEQKRRETITIISRSMRRDLKRVKPDDPIASLHADCILLCLVKNLKADSDVPALDLYNPYGLAMDLLVRDYLGNFLMLGIRTREDMVEYVRCNCLYAEDFNVKYEDTKSEPAWGFFTSKGYILCFTDSKRIMFVYDDAYPNNVYYPCNDLLYQGARYLQFPSEKERASGSAYRDFDGIILFGENLEVIAEMSRFFERNNIFYQMDRYIAAESRIYDDRESLLEVKRVSDHLFRDFGYIPFCLYDEWAAIQNAVAQDDPLLNQLIEKKNNGHKKSPHRETAYTSRIVDAFNKGGRELMNSLHIEDESIARGLVWSYFNESLVDNLSREWIRLGGDIIASGESPETAFEKYANLTAIDPDKAYYLGLFIYYLITKRVLPDDDFLANYERALPVYVHCQKKIQYDGEVEIPRILLEKQSDGAGGDLTDALADQGVPQNSIDDWALTEEEARAAQDDRNPEPRKIIQTVVKKVAKDNGEIVEKTEEIEVERPSGSKENH